MKKKYPQADRPAGELVKLLHERLDAIESHCLNYDQGRRHFAADISICLRSLLYDNSTNGNRSHIQQLGLDLAQYVDSKKTMLGQHNSGVSFGGMVKPGVVFKDNIPTEDWTPNLNLDLQIFGPIMHTDFVEWWKTPILFTYARVGFSREKIVKDMANQDASHIAVKLNEAYFDLTRNSNIGVFFQIIEGDAVTDPNPHIAPERITNVSKEGSGINFVGALVRQIANEVLLTDLPSKVKLPS